MKKSNIIVIALSAFIVLSILIFYIDAKTHKTKHDTIFETVQLPEFSVIVVEENADVHIIQSDTIQLKIKTLKDSVNKTANYSIANDTLHLYKGNRLFVYNKNTQTIISKNAFWAGIQFEKLDSLNLDIQNTENFTINTNSEKCDVLKLKLNSQKNSKIYINNGINVKNMAVILKNSELTIWGGNYKNASIEALVNSQVQINEGKNVENIITKKDASSRFNIYN